MSFIEKGTQAFMTAAGQLKNVGFSGEFHDPTRSLRRALHREESDEYMAAECNNDLVEVLDGLADIIVVALGTMYAYVGPVITEEILNEVAASNLSKVQGGKVIKNAAGKIMKPDGYFKPNIRGILDANLDG